VKGQIDTSPVNATREAASDLHGALAARLPRPATGASDAGPVLSENEYEAAARNLIGGRPGATNTAGGSKVDATAEENKEDRQLQGWQHASELLSHTRVPEVISAWPPNGMRVTGGAPPGRAPR
jgi:hypothetical protein